VSGGDLVFVSEPDLSGAVRALRVDSARREARPDRVIVFFSGFMVSPWSYRSLFASIVSERTSIVAPQMYRRGPRALAGHPSAIEEAARGIRLVEHVVASRRPDEVWIGGHSRGGQVAWRVADRVRPDGVVVIDPVDGAGLGGRCAPAAVNHDHFAAAAPPGSTHVVIPSMGHGDMLDDRPARAARRLCGGSNDPGHERRALAELISRFVDQA
jgi:acetyl esterase/lipase